MTRPRSSSMFVLLFLLVLVANLKLTCAQYEQGPYKGAHYEQQQVMGETEDIDERPKVHVGFRLRVPAFRFDLPQVNLPKITISAKIQQPNRVRTIRLPEINLDTSSHVSSSSNFQYQEQMPAPVPPPVKNYYRYTRPNVSSSYYSMPPSTPQVSYNTQVFSLSAQEESPSVSKGYGVAPNVNHNSVTYQRPIINQPDPSFSYARMKDAELGFDQPVEVYGMNSQPRPIRSTGINNSVDQYPRPQVKGNYLYQKDRGSRNRKKRFRKLIYG